MLAILLSLTACGPTCGRAAAQPVEGYWSWEDDGVQQVTSTGPGSFVGTMVKLSTTVECPAQVGHVVLKLHGSGTHYTGQDEWFRTGDCARKFSIDAVVDLLKSNNVAHLCSTGPFTNVASVHDCTELKRITNYKPG